ncbi:MAG: Integral membrane protein [Oceanicaulis sp. HLUCCA04]|nr:MAG: Integral membrane protein [Oceanicaulis sp. HLUCCA04]
MSRHPLLRGEPHFKWRSPEVSRVENLSDIVFALVLTLAAANSVPASFDDLTNLWRNGLSMAACFALILSIWHTHHVFFRRYNLQDGWTVFLNAVLLCLILVFIYPLKFMADFFFNLFTGGFASTAEVQAVITVDQVAHLYLVYGIFYIAVQMVFVLLYSHALRLGDQIELDDTERSFTRYEIEVAAGTGLLTVLVIASAYLLPPPFGPMSGMAFFLIGLIAYVSGKRAQARLASPATPD